MSTVVRAADPAHLIALIPQLLGYVPTRSLVVIPMDGSRSLGALRLDLPPDDPDVDPFAGRVIGMLCRIPAADGLTATVFTDDSMDAGPPHRGLCAALLRHAHESGLDVLDVHIVGADEWCSPFDDPPRIHSLSELPATGLPAVVGDQFTGVALVPATGARRRAMRAARRSLQGALHAACGIRDTVPGADRIDPRAWEAVALLDDLPDLYEDLLDGGRLDPMRAALLEWCFDRPSLRDVALVQWTSNRAGGADAVAAQARWESGEEYPRGFASVMWGEGPSPDPDRLRSALAVSRDVAAYAARRRRAGPLAMCAWLSWALGLSSHADRYAEEALACDPDHGLAQIVRSFVVAAHLPDWVFRRGAAT